MSVKDKIAMWNNIGSSTNTAKESTLPPKNTFTFKTTVSETEKTNVQYPNKPISGTTQNKGFIVEAEGIKKPSDMKKEQPAVKPVVITSPTPVVPSSTSQSEAILKPSEIRKRLAEGQPLYITAPIVPVQRTSTPMVYQNNVYNEINSYPESKGDYEIVKDVPIGSVKENAKKLSEFYLNQALQLARIAEEQKNGAIEKTQTYQESTTQAEPKQEFYQSEDVQPVQEQAAITYEQSGNITFNYQANFTAGVAENTEKPEQIQHNDNYDLASMMRSKKKITKPVFSDED